MTNLTTSRAPVSPMARRAAARYTGELNGLVGRMKAEHRNDPETLAVVTNTVLRHLVGTGAGPSVNEPLNQTLRDLRDHSLSELLTRFPATQVAQMIGVSPARLSVIRANMRGNL